MMKAVIVDDEESAIKSLKWEINTYCKDQIEIIETFNDPIKAIDYLKNEEISCLFLDIDMPKISGLQLVEFFPERNFEIIFTTAYNQYAINAIKKKAFDYLLKPIDSDDLINAVNSLEKHLEHKDKDDIDEELILNAIKKASENKTISFSVGGKIIFVNESDIIFCKSDGNYTEIFTTSENKPYTITKKLKEVVETISDTSKFIRVHNSFYINLSFIKEYDKSMGHITLHGDYKIPVSRQRKSAFLSSISGK